MAPASSSSTATCLTTADEVRVVLAQAETFGFQHGVWHAINAPPSMLTHEPEVTLAGRLHLGAEELAAALASLGLKQARQAAWAKVLLGVRPPTLPHLTIETTNVQLNYRSGGDVRIAFVRFAPASVAMSDVTPRDQLAMGSSHRQPLPIWKTHNLLTIFRSAEATKAAEAAAAAEAVRKAREAEAREEAAE